MNFQVLKAGGQAMGKLGWEVGGGNRVQKWKPKHKERGHVGTRTKEDEWDGSQLGMGPAFTCKQTMTAHLRRQSEKQERSMCP